MLVLLPFLIFGVGAGTGICSAVGYEGPMRAVMAVVWITAAFAASLLLYVAVLGLIALFIDKNKPQKTCSPFFFGITNYSLGCVCSLVRARIHLIGEDKIPEGRWFLVSNHKSCFDPLVTMWALRKHRLTFISKPENLKIPIFGALAHKCCCLAINRENDRAALRTILDAAELMKNDEVCMGVYPEGTRNKGEGLLPFRNGAFKTAQKAKVPIVIVMIEHTADIKKNFPFKHTDVNLRVLDVLDTEQVLSMKTTEIGERIRECMECASA